MTLRAAPKPEKPIRDRRYMADVRSLGCIICGTNVEVEVHHVITGRYSQRKASDLETICLCGWHHRQRHASPSGFRAMYGDELEMAAKTKLAVEKMRAELIGGR